MFHKIRLPEFPAPLLFSLPFSRPPFLCRVKKILASDEDDGKQGWFAVPVPPSSGSRFQVTGLSPSTDYQFSILSQNKMGTGPFSDITAARTLGQYHPPPLPPRFYLICLRSCNFERLILFWHKIRFTELQKLTNLLSDVCIPPHFQLQLIKVNSAQRPEANFSGCVINMLVSVQPQ